MSKKNSRKVSCNSQFRTFKNDRQLSAGKNKENCQHVSITRGELEALVAGSTRMDIVRAYMAYVDAYADENILRIILGMEV